jgi:hypothetical protein
MTGPDHDDDGRGFLARWSQRKHEAKQPEPKRDVPAAEAEVPKEPVSEGDATQQFDLSSLPKLEDLTETTDITGFLRKGVPEHLRNAVLRKSWALDPAIRNYVNPALDYAYDWNTAGGVPGSSEIGADVDVARLVSQIMGSEEPGAEPAVPAVAPENEPASDTVRSPTDDGAQEVEPDLPTQSLRGDHVRISIAQEPSNIEERVRIEAEPGESSSAALQQGVRRHGSAKPLD